jgi:hypothetical protein
MATGVDPRVGKKQGTTEKLKVRLVGSEEDGACWSTTSSPGKKWRPREPVCRVLQLAAQARTGCWMMRMTQRCFGSAQTVEELGGWWCSLANRGGGQRVEARVSRATAWAWKKRKGRARLGHALVL